MAGCLGGAIYVVGYLGGIAYLGGNFFFLKLKILKLIKKN